ncbi:sulfotransferase [Nocardioides perillae]|uniref:Sulfotransferase family protein n=1 Tax=Nocardioides perillae TaxID=1119534 RepID=A0A7Y9RWU3_9ACTN|nr:sulfotransferase [Nocardioides perillae]NYG56866.1 hypothetical protein [Nocardioides perillae]
MLGIGAQKAGTTWLYDYVKDAPGFAAGYRKEYHVFDARDLAEEQWLLENHVRDAERSLQDLRQRGKARAGVVHRAAMVAEPRFYFDYFTGLLASREGAQLAADVTPDYCLLSGERFASIRTQFERRRVRVAPVFLMRDPVERIHSTLRMMERVGTDFFTGSPEQALLEHHRRANLEKRTRYDRTIASLEHAFRPDEVFYGFYEELFSTSEVRRLCDFLAVPFHEPALDKRSNAAPQPAEDLPEQTVQAVATHYRPVYEFMADRFGRDKVLRLWPSARFVL